MRKLQSLSEDEFYRLKALGMLWEIYPESPEFFNELKWDKEYKQLIHNYSFGWKDIKDDM